MDIYPPTFLAVGTGGDYLQFQAREQEKEEGWKAYNGGDHYIEEQNIGG